MKNELLATEAVENLPIFRNMTDAERDELVGIASTMEFSSGETILRQGKSSQNLLVILEGKAQVVKETAATPPAAITLAELGPHDHFGEMSFFHAAPHSASVIARSRVKLLRIERKDYERLISQSAPSALKLAYNVAHELAGRLRRMDQWVGELTGNHTAEEQASEWSTFRDKLFNAWKL